MIEVLPPFYMCCWDMLTILMQEIVTSKGTPPKMEIRTLPVEKLPETLVPQETTLIIISNKDPSNKK